MMAKQNKFDKWLEFLFVHGNPSEQPIGILSGGKEIMKDEKQQALETRDALQMLFGVEDSGNLFKRLEVLHDITYALALATTDAEKAELVEKIKKWYELCDF